ncbi:hypothetical protein BKI52_09350 [marine bacterium AO1-C]|nr:hypothetical protein BKI52_09350 [marine bacterium AO1-C]
MKNILKGVFALSLALTMVACGNLGGGNKSQLIAKSWELDIEAMTGKEKKDKDDVGSQIVGALSGLLSKAIRFEFKSDGTFNANSPLLGSNKEQVGKWKIDGSDLVLTVNDEDKKIEIVKLTNTQLVLGGGEKGKEIYLKPKSE